MDLEGADTYFVAIGDVKRAVQRFAQSLLALWPNVWVSIVPHDDPNGDWQPGVGSVDDVDPAHAEVYFARDELMVDHFHECSYAPVADGSGVVAVWFSRLSPDERSGPFTIPADQSVSPAGSPIDATLVLPGSACWVMLLTPTHPSDGEFSQAIKELLHDAIARECF